MPVPLSFDLTWALVSHAATTEPGEAVDPSTSPELRAAGVGVVTMYVQQLLLLGILSEATPPFGANGGMWIGYQLSDRGRALANSEGELRRAVAPLTGGPRSEVTEAVAELQRDCEVADLNPIYRDEFLKTIDEVRICFDEVCFIAAIALCGKILEVCLKEILARHGVQIDPNAIVGPLIRAIRERVPSEYVDPGLANVASIINSSRITAVHAKERIPVPTRDQAVMVIFATRDAVRRSLTRSR